MILKVGFVKSFLIEIVNSPQRDKNLILNVSKPLSRIVDNFQSKTFSMKEAMNYYDFFKTICGKLHIIVINSYVLALGVAMS